MSHSSCRGGRGGGRRAGWEAGSQPPRPEPANPQGLPGLLLPGVRLTRQTQPFPVGLLLGLSGLLPQTHVPGLGFGLSCLNRQLLGR